MKKCNLPNKVRISDQVLFQEIEGESVLLNLKNEQYYGLNDVGTSFWHLLYNDESIENVLLNLRHEYKVDEDTLRNDILNLINELDKNGLVTIN